MTKTELLRACQTCGYIPGEASWRERNGTIYLMTRHDMLPVLLIVGQTEGFSGQSVDLNGIAALACPISRENVKALQRAFPYTAPASTSEHAITVGVGDRLGLVTGAHIRAFCGSPVFPVLAQQSKRELALTGRTNRSMLDDVAWQVFESGYEGGYAADGDHLKTADGVRQAITDGDTMITLDCSEHIDNAAASLGRTEAEALCRQRFGDAQVDIWNAAYAGRHFALGDHGDICFSPEELPRIYLIYGKALDFVEMVYHDIIDKSPHPVALEVSIDETETETSPAAHFFVASELKRRAVVFGSLAPRFCGEFQKGIDYIGDVDRFRVEFATHAQIAEKFGYRISVHSGSDKFSIFPYVGQLTNGRFHLKTSGTSWVEAVRVIAECDPALFRRMVHYSCGRYPEAKAFYHVTGQVEKVPDVDAVADTELPYLLDETDTRQVMHITYGFLLQEKDAEGRYVFRDDIYRTLRQHKKELDDTISRHIRKHLVGLGVLPSGGK